MSTIQSDKIQMFVIFKKKIETFSVAFANQILINTKEPHTYCGIISGVVYYYYYYMLYTLRYSITMAPSMYKTSGIKCYQKCLLPYQAQV